VAVLAVVCAAFAISAARRMGRRQTILEGALNAMRHDIEVIAGSNDRHGQRLNTLECSSESFGDRVRLVELRSGSRSLDEAIDSARRGADAGKLTEQFGLTGGEADLVTRLHRKTRP
jgi:hypothetical protein